MKNHDKRLAPLKITAEQYIFSYFEGQDNPDGTRWRTSAEDPFYQEYLETDKEDNIIINYPAIQAAGRQTYLDGKKGLKFFSRKRLAQPQGDMKYVQPKSSGVRIFYPKNTLEKIRTMQEIPVLYMVEGEFKSIYGDFYGLDIIGLGGIQNFIEGKGSKQLNSDITYIINACKVQKVVLIGDADVRALDFHHGRDQYKDLSQRLFNFYTACKKLKLALEDSDTEAYFIHIKDEYYETAKGLDDLYAFLPEETEAITADIQKLRKAEKYFNGINLSRSDKELREHFFLNVEKNKAPLTFYRRFHDKLDTHKFIFNRAVWRWSDVEGDLMMVQHQDSFVYARIGCSYVKQIFVPNSKGVQERRLEPWLKGELVQDYVKEQGVRDFLSMVKKYDAFTNVPFNDPNEYKQVIDNCYNLYYKVEHKPEPGTFPHIEKYLKHLFQNKYQDKYEVILDYLTLLYTDPNQMLPIIVLASRERETGKSTFLWFMTWIFGENATVIGNDEITDTYNDDYASKLVIGLEEGFIEKRAVLEKIKSWSTSPTINLSTKFKSRQRISFFGKIIITTNDETSFVKIDSEETRFVICKVPAIATEDLDPELDIKIKEEIPAFLYFLKTREIIHKKQTRHWFAKETLETDALRKLKMFSKPAIQKEIEVLIREKFMTYKESPIHLSLLNLHTELNDAHSRKQYDRPYIQRTLEEDMQPAIPFNAKGRYDYLKTIPQYADDENGRQSIVGYDIVRDKMQNKHYKFYAERFLSPEEITEYQVKNIEENEDHQTANVEAKGVEDLPF